MAMPLFIQGTCLQGPRPCSSLYIPPQTGLHKPRLARCRLRQSHLAASGGDASMQGPGESAKPNQAGGSDNQDGFWKRLKTTFLGDKKMDRQRLAELGFGAFAAYGVISNLNACVLMTMAWLTLVKTTGATPFMPGMWPKFLAIYGGLWLGAGFMRPIRLSLAIGAAPAFDNALGTIMRRTRANKVVAFAILLVGIAAASFALLGGVLLLLGGLPKRA